MQSTPKSLLIMYERLGRDERQTALHWMVTVSKTTVPSTAIPKVTYNNIYWNILDAVKREY